MRPYGILVAVMLLTGRLVARETGRTGLGAGGDGPGRHDVADGDARHLVFRRASRSGRGSASWRRSGMPSRTGGRAAGRRWCSRRSRPRWPAGSGRSATWPGPVAAVYLWVDGRRRCRLAAAVPLAATVLAVVPQLILGLRRMDSTVSFHGRTVLQAVSPLQGCPSHRPGDPREPGLRQPGPGGPHHADPGLVLTLALLAFWISRRWRRSRPAHRPGRRLRSSAVRLRPGIGSFPFNPLECAGAAWWSGATCVEWAFRGYLDFTTCGPSTLCDRALVRRDPPDRCRALRGGMVVRAADGRTSGSRPPDRAVRLTRAGRPGPRGC